MSVIAPPQGLNTNNSVQYRNVQGKPTVIVTPNGPNDGGDFGPNTPSTTTAGIQEAVNSLAVSGGTVLLTALFSWL